MNPMEEKERRPIPTLQTSRAGHSNSSSISLNTTCIFAICRSNGQLSSECSQFNLSFRVRVSNQCCILKIIGRTKVKQMQNPGRNPSLWLQLLYIPRWWFCGCWFIVYYCSRCLCFFLFGPCLCNAVLNILSSFSLRKREMVALL